MRETVPCSSPHPLPASTSPRRRGAERARAFSSLLRNKERTATFPKRKSCEASLPNVTLMEDRKEGSREHYNKLNLCLANCESQCAEEIFLPAGSGKTCLYSPEALTSRRQTMRLFSL